MKKILVYHILVGCKHEERYSLKCNKVNMYIPDIPCFRRSRKYVDREIWRDSRDGRAPSG
jgi:hypothetical protein